MTDMNIQTQIISYAKDGSIRPNVLFHRPWNSLHSRCIEYPFAASTLRGRERVLDVGSSHGSDIWVQYLCSQNVEVYFSDYDDFPVPVDGAHFVKGDCRSLPFPDASFDRIVGVSVLEHIGLLSAQCHGAMPSFDPDGDKAALREWHRLLRPGGELVLTFPFGQIGGFTPEATARRYSEKDLETLFSLFSPRCLDYYEYQYRQYVAYYDEKSPRIPSNPTPCALFEDMQGKVVWRRIPRQEARAQNESNMDGILCSVWSKGN